jgi:hypothetical protein
MSTRRVQLDRKGTEELLNTERLDRIPQNLVGPRVTIRVVTTSAKTLVAATTQGRVRVLVVDMIPVVDTDPGRTSPPKALTIRVAASILDRVHRPVALTILVAVTILAKDRPQVVVTIQEAVTILDRVHRPVALTIQAAVTILAKDRPPEVVTIQEAVTILAKAPVQVTTLVSAHRATDRRTVELLTHHPTNMNTVMSLPSLANQQSTYISVSPTQSVKTK